MCVGGGVGSGWWCGVGEWVVGGGWERCDAHTTDWLSDASDL